MLRNVVIRYIIKICLYKELLLNIYWSFHHVKKWMESPVDTWIFDLNCELHCR